MDKSTRAPRELETREKAERPKQWMPPKLLPDPHPEEGYAFRWIRTSTLNNSFFKPLVMIPCLFVPASAPS